MRETETDILIVGGGFVGASLALAAARLGYEPLLLDGGGMPEGEDPRASMLSASSLGLLRRLGVVEAEDCLQPVREMMISHGEREQDGGDVSPVFLNFPGKDRRRETPLAWMVENRRLRAGMERAIHRAGLQRWTPAMVVECEAASGHRMRARLQDGRSIRARLCIAADGGHSRLREYAGVETLEWRYEGRALTAVVSHEWEHSGIAYEHFSSSGLFAVLPLPGRRSSIVWAESTETAEALVRCEEHVFLSQARRRMGGERGDNLALESRRLAYPLQLKLARSQGARGMLLVGDAAHVIHPLAGQGLNMGLKDVLALEKLLGESRRLGLALDAGLLLERYERMRRFDNLAMAMIVDGTYRLFRGDGGPLRLMRDVCLGTAQASPWIRAMGERVTG